jgi:hypothetical protein
MSSLRPSARTPINHQQAQFPFLQADVDVDPVRPQIHIIHSRQIAFAERALLGLPLLGQLRDHRPRQALRRAKELPQRGHEVPRRETMQVEQRQHLGDLRGLPRPRRQDRRGEPLALARIRVDTLSFTRGAVTSPVVLVAAIRDGFATPFDDSVARPSARAGRARRSGCPARQTAFQTSHPRSGNGCWTRRRATPSPSSNCRSGSGTSAAESHRRGDR